MPTIIVNTALKAKAKVRPGLDKAWPWRLHHCDARKLSACYDGARDVVDSRHLRHFITTSDRHTNNHICVSPSPLVDGLTRRRRLCQTTAFCRHSNTRCYSRTRSSFGDRTFAAAGPLTSLEQSAAQSQTMWTVIRQFQAVTEDIFIRTVWTI